MRPAEIINIFTPTNTTIPSPLRHRTYQPTTSVHSPSQEQNRPHSRQIYKPISILLGLPDTPRHQAINRSNLQRIPLRQSQFIVNVGNKVPKRRIVGDKELCLYGCGGRRGEFLDYDGCLRWIEAMQGVRVELSLRKCVSPFEGEFRAGRSC